MFLKGWTEVELLDVCSWLWLRFWCASALPAALLLPPSLPLDLCAGSLVWRRGILWHLSLCVRATWGYGTQSHCAQRLDWSHAGSKGDQAGHPHSPSLTGFTSQQSTQSLYLPCHVLCFLCNNLSLYHGLPAGQSQSMSIFLILKYFWLPDFSWISCYFLKIKGMDFYLLLKKKKKKLHYREAWSIEPLFPHERSSHSLIQDVYTVQFADFHTLPLRS